MKEKINFKSLLLEDIRVLDLTRFLAGPYSTTMLADMGAEVIKIEPKEGDELRRFPPYDKKGKASGYFISLNRNKKSIYIGLEEGTRKRDIQGTC